eukprot:347016-Chlamydomonas_euryale.AAC.6
MDEIPLGSPNMLRRPTPPRLTASTAAVSAVTANKATSSCSGNVFRENSTEQVVLRAIAAVCKRGKEPGGQGHRSRAWEAVQSQAVMAVSALQSGQRARASGC